MPKCRRPCERGREYPSKCDICLCLHDIVTALRYERQSPAMDIKTVFIFALSAVLADMAQGQCGPTGSCSSGACQLGLTFPRLCGICVCVNMSASVVIALVLITVYSQEASASCLPSLPCRCPCELGLEYPSNCGICVCRAMSVKVVAGLVLLFFYCDSVSEVMSLKVVAVLVLLSIYCHVTSGYLINTATDGTCLPSLPCHCPCELGLESSSGCGLCVCPPSCVVCESACYYPAPDSASCPACAPPSLCYGGGGVVRK
ncbi:hypothetical protein HPB50_024862 [Hyalomma asiaticum]|uniref:Uncharacterized protein n=1 Tax=Hyalomma asiaticum TaxID=266040 RepID=A0ACB7SIS0_HYAAI|nr:hypothetical protein HPB50_024862 [Hyalomma asiaticum]